MTPEAIRSLFEMGLTQTQVARRLGVSDTAIFKARERFGIAYRGRHGIPPRVGRETMRSLLTSGLTASEIADQTGYCLSHVYDRARRFGVRIGGQTE